LAPPPSSPTETVPIDATTGRTIGTIAAADDPGAPGFAAGGVRQAE
jgi:hypothetical protein